MKNFFIILNLFFAVNLFSSSFESIFPYSNSGSTFHFSIFSFDRNLTYKIENVIEKYYREIISDIGWGEYIFKGRKIKIYVFKNKKQYLKYVKAPSWSGGEADIKNNCIYLYPHKDFLKSTLPHELTHLVFRNVFKKNIFIWLDEGMAVYEESKFSNLNINSKNYKRWILRNKKIPLRYLFENTPKHYSTSAYSTYWYICMASVIHYLIKIKGRWKFSRFLKNLEKYKNIDKAIAHTYPQYDFENVEELESRWRKFLKN